MKNKKVKKVIFLAKQVLPLMYFSKYKDAKGNLYIAVWRQWFGKVLSKKSFKVCNQCQSI